MNDFPTTLRLFVKKTKWNKAWLKGNIEHVVLSKWVKKILSYVKNILKLQQNLQ